MYKRQVLDRDIILKKEICTMGTIIAIGAGIAVLTGEMCIRDRLYTAAGPRDFSNQRSGHRGGGNFCVHQ